MPKVRKLSRPSPPPPKAEPVAPTEFAVVSTGPNGSGRWVDFGRAGWGWVADDDPGDRR